MPFMHRARGKASVFIEHYPNPDPDDFDPELAAKFTYTSKNPVDFCNDNSLVAALHGRSDYRRIFESLAVMLRNRNIYENLWSEDDPDGRSQRLSPVIKGIHKTSVLCLIMLGPFMLTFRSYENLLRRRNLQMLAMFSMAVLLADSAYQSGSRGFFHSFVIALYTDPDLLEEGQDIPSRSDTNDEEEPITLAFNMDYFSLRPRTEPIRPVSPSSPPPASPEVETPPAASTPPPQKSLAAKAGASFGGVLYPFFFAGTSEGSEPSRKSRGSDPPTPTPNEVPGSIPVPRRGSFFRHNPRSPRPHRGKSDASAPASGSMHTASSSTGTSSFGRLGLPGKGKKVGSASTPTPGASHKVTITFALLGQPKAYVTSAIPQERYRREGKPPVPSAKYYRTEERHASKKRSTMPEAIRARYITHVHVYAELLFWTGLLDARSEVLAITNQAPLDSQLSSIDRDHLSEHNPLVRMTILIWRLAIWRLCGDCGEQHEDISGSAVGCPKRSLPRPSCAYCRLPVRGE